MLKPLEQFYCDTCGMLIEDSADGYLEWLRYKHPTHKRDFYKEFRICHVVYKCRKHARAAQRNHDIHDEGNHLKYFLGEHGYIQLLDRLDRGPEIDSDYQGVSVEDFREYVILMKRLTIPHYEEARQYWEDAKSDGFFDGVPDYKFFFQETLTDLIREYNGAEDSQETSE